MTDNAVRTYEIQTTLGLIRMDIPEDWKVTYGPVSPGNKGTYGEGNALRVYESETKQRAIFVGVTAFRDLSIPVKRLLVKRKGEDNWSTDSTGNSSRNSKEIVERRWVSEEEYLGIKSETGEELPF